MRFHIIEMRQMRNVRLWCQQLQWLQLGDLPVQDMRWD